MAEPTGSNLPFALELSGQGGVLQLDRFPLSPLIEIRQLTVALPHLARGVEFSGGARAFRHHRGQLRRFTAAFDGGALRVTLRERASHAVQGLQLDLGEDTITVGGFVTHGASRARAVWRGRLVPAGEASAHGLLLSVVDAFVVGWLPLPALSLTARLLDCLPPESVERRGASHVILAPLRPLLKEILVARGYKLPAHGTASAAQVALAGDTLQFHFEPQPLAQRSSVATAEIPDTRSRLAHERFVSDLEWKRHHARLDELIVEGALDQAIRECQRRSTTQGDGGFLEGRLLDVLRCRELTFEAAEELAGRRLAAMPGDVSALLALSAIREHSGQAVAAAQLLERLARKLDPAHDGLLLEHCRLHQAELVAPEHPDQAEAALRAAIADRPQSGAALAMLADLVAVRGASDEACRLRARLLAADVDEAVRVAAALQVAQHHMAANSPERARPFLHYLHEAYETAAAASSPAPVCGAARGQLAHVLIELELATGAHERAYAVAAAEFERLLASGAREPTADAAVRLAELLVEPMNRPAEAARVLERAGTALAPAPALFERAAELWRMAGDTAAARQAGLMALAALAAAPAQPALLARIQTGLALNAAAREDSVADARAHFLRALDALPNHLPALEGLEAITRQPEEWDELVARLHRALAICGGDEGVAPSETRALLALRLALIYARTFGFLEDALPLLEQSLAWRPDNPFALRHLVELTRQVGDWRRHRDALLTLLARATNRAERARLLAELAEVEANRLHEPDLARQRLEELLREQPRDRQALLQFSLLLTRLGDTRELARVLRRRAALAASTAERRELLLDLAELQLDQLQQVDEAEATLAAASGVGEPPAAADARPHRTASRWTWLKNRVRARRAVPQPAAPARPATATTAEAAPPSANRPPKSAIEGAAERWHDALAVADKGDLAAAIALLHDAVMAAPSHRPSWDLLLALHTLRGDEQEALTVACAIAELDRSAPSAAADKGEEPPVAAPRPGAGAGLVRASANGSAPVQRAAGRASGTEAGSAPRRDDVVVSDRVERLLDRVRQAVGEHRPDEALPLCEEALALDPDSVETLDLIVPLWQAAGEPRRAAEALGRRAELTWDAELAPALTRRAALAFAALGDAAAAQALFRRYLRWAPTDDEVFEQLATDFRDRGDTASLESLLDERVAGLCRLRAEQGDETLGVSLSLLTTERAALLQEQHGNAERAIELLQQARRDWPRNEEALERLAELLEAAGRFRELADVLEALISLTEERSLRALRLERLVRLYRETLDDPVAARETLRVALRELTSDEAVALRRLVEGEPE
jgi:tetratricopeptide (TPR) repeat protein